MLDWLIIGGGLHGAHLALVLTGRCGVAPEQLRILDPHEELLAHWERCTAATGMRYLRSTIVHHLALDPHDLWHFARRRGLQPGMVRGPYKRPALGLFREHCQTQIAEHSLDRRHLRGRASGLTQTEQDWCVDRTRQGISTRRTTNTTRFYGGARAGCGKRWCTTHACCGRTRYRSRRTATCM